MRDAKITAGAPLRFGGKEIPINEDGTLVTPVETHEPEEVGGRYLVLFLWGFYYY